MMQFGQLYCFLKSLLSSPKCYHGGTFINVRYQTWHNFAHSCTMFTITKAWFSIHISSIKIGMNNNGKHIRRYRILTNVE